MQVQDEQHHDCNFMVPEARRNHIACILNQHMIVYGGVNDFSRFLNDVVVLNLKQQKWSQIYKSTHNDSLLMHPNKKQIETLPALSRARGCLVTHSHR